MEFPVDELLARIPAFEQLTQRKLERISSGRGLVDLSMINPDIASPRLLIDKLLEASMRPGSARYATSRGVRKLREAFALKYHRAFEVNVDPEQEICVTLGAKDGWNMLLQALTRPGDTVLLPAPTYPAYLSAAVLLGLRPTFYQVHPNSEDTLRAIEEQLKVRPEPKVLLLNFPHNPLGYTVSASFYNELATSVAGIDCVVVNDFVYGELGHRADGRRSSIQASMLASIQASMLAERRLFNRGAEIYSMSKAYSVPGWRIGAVIGSAEIIRRVSRLKGHADYGQFLPLQAAAAAGLSAEESPALAVSEIYRGRAEIVTRGLQRSGWRVAQPEAGCSVWAEPPSQLCSTGSLDLCLQLLEQTGISLTPGALFGADYDSFIRLALVLPEAKLRAAVSTLAAFSNGAPVSSAGATAVYE